MSTYSQFLVTHQTQARWRYQVKASLKNQKALDRYLEWLLDGHVQAVCHWAQSAEVVLLENTAENDTKNAASSIAQVLSVYWFKSKAEFEKYEKEGAPKLREEGIALAQELGGIEFSRSLGWAWSCTADLK